MTVGFLEAAGQRMLRRFGFLSRGYYALRFRWDRWTRPDPILIYQMGKVGSSTILESLKAAVSDRPVYQVHYLSPEGLERAGRANIAGHLPIPPGHIWMSRSIRARLDRGENARPWKIVSLVREPVARNISAFFQNLDLRYREFEKEYAAGSVGLEELIRTFLESYPHDLPLAWFDTEMKTVFGVDVYAERFPREKGYAVYRLDRAELLLIRFENLNECATEAFREFLGLDHFSLRPANLARDKDYFEAYRAFLDQIRLPGDYLEKMYASKYAQHFYSKEEIAGFVSRWKTAPDRQPAR